MTYDRKVSQGIYLRHQNGCGTHCGESCDCTPGYQARVMVDGERLSSTHRTLDGAEAWRVHAQADGRLQQLTSENQQLRRDLERCQRELEFAREELIAERENSMHSERMFTSREIAELCQVGTRTVHDAIRSGDLAASEVRPGVYRLGLGALGRWRGLHEGSFTRASFCMQIAYKRLALVPLLDTAGMARRLGVSTDYVERHREALGGFKLPHSKGGGSLWRFNPSSVPTGRQAV